MVYVIEYWLPNQSHFFSYPQMVEVKNESELNKALEIAKKNGYEVIAICEKDKQHEQAAPEVTRAERIENEI